MSKTIEKKFDSVLIANERALYLVRTLLDQMCDDNKMERELIMINLSITARELSEANADAL
ncbi:hypothetical protein EFU61_18280 [Vibrio cholerae]|nr:hypothetical protein [Vibrio cholerae]EGR1020637.1 hypothetical protein [Vibrio cholerae]EIN5953748.1 hypothetical protein [Vibrio cholerae]